MEPSSVLLPTSSGTGSWAPRSNAASVSHVSTRPSTIGLKCPAAAASSTADRLRSSAGSLAPADLANATPAASACASVRIGPSGRLMPAELWPITRANSPAASGDAMRWQAMAAPAEFPASVTCPGSPPKARMLSRTQPSAAMMSSRAQLPEVPSAACADSCGWARKPSAPRR